MRKTILTVIGIANIILAVLYLTGVIHTGISANVYAGLLNLVVGIYTLTISLIS